MIEHTEIDIENNIFRKFISPHKFEEELRRSILVARFSKENTYFNTLEVLSSSSEKCKIEFQLLQNFSTFRHSYLINSRFFSSQKQFDYLKSLFGKLGKALSFIHSYNTSESSRTFPDGYFPEKFSNPTDQVFIHGDFTMSNILMKDNELIIIDWNTSSLFDFSVDLGPRYWDISFLLSSFFTLSLTTLFSFNQKKCLLSYFLLAYLEGNPIDRVIFLSELQEFVNEFNYYNLKEYENVFAANQNSFLFKSSQKQLNAFLEDLPHLFS